MSIYTYIMLVYVAVTAAIELLALWAAADRRALLPRTLVLWGAILLLLPIRAYDAALLLTISSALTVAIVSAIERFWPQARADEASPPQRWRFSLADIIVLTLFVATFLALAPESQAAAQRPYRPLPTAVETALAATLIAFISVLAYYTAVGPRRVTTGLLTVLAAMFAACATNVRGWPRFVDGLGDEFAGVSPFYLSVGVTVCGALSVWLLLGGSDGPSSTWRRRAGLLSTIVAVTLAISLIGILGDLSWRRLVFRPSLRIIGFQAISPLLLGLAIFTVSAAGRAIWRQRESSTSRLRLGCAVALSVVVGLPAAWLYWQMLWLAPYPSVVYEQPNSYDRIVAIAGQIGQPAFTPGRHPLLDEAVALLQAPNHIPLAVRQDHTEPFYKRVPHQQLHWLSEHLDQAARLSAGSGEPDLGADDAIAILRLGNMLARGGFPVDAADGGQISGRGYHVLAAHRARFSSSKPVKRSPPCNDCWTNGTSWR